MMKQIIVIMLFSCMFFACNESYIDTGLAVSKHDKTMYDYLKSDSYNWDTICKIIDRAGLKSLFDGTDQDYKEITFFGPTNFSIVRWMKNSGKARVDQLTSEECAAYVRRFIVKGKMMKSDFDYEIKGSSEGGTEVVKADGNKIRVFRRRTDWGTVGDAGPEELHVQSYVGQTTVMVASADIQTNTGVVHSLSYVYTFGDF